MEKQGIEKLRELIADIKVGMMATMGENGELHSRPMWTQQTDFEEALWFFTKRHAHKSQELERDSHVLITFADPEDGCYVSVSGKAELVMDPQKAKQLWQPVYQTWFADGLEDPELALIRVVVDKADYWDSRGNQVVQLKMAG